VVQAKTNKEKFERLFDRTLRLIAARPRSQQEIKTYLRGKRAGFDLAKKIIDRLTLLGQIDDRAFTAWWLEQRSTFRPRAKKALRMELRQKGVDKEIIDEALAEVNEAALAKKAIEKKMKSYQSLPARKLREKIYSFLYRQGFGWEAISEVLEEKVKKR